MKIEEYVEMRKRELDKFREMYFSENKKDPENWPFENAEGEWYDQELAFNSMEGK